MKINFVDVGQGDCSFIITPDNKTILIDGGGNMLSSYDVGKKVVLPYILNRGYTKIDYVFISHFDQDHCGGILYLINEIKVNNVIIGKQYEQYENYKKFIEIAKSKKINIIPVKNNDKIKIEKNLCFNILWPDVNNMINENSINNNSMVFKLKYKSFSMLFTGDIEKIAENEIIQKYRDKNILKSNIIKIAHHGSKTSSTDEFLELVNAKEALIGVGKNNKFGHPNQETLEKLEAKKIRIYRTDENGEINIITDGNKYRIKTKMYNYIKKGK